MFLLNFLTSILKDRDGRLVTLGVVVGILLTCAGFQVVKTFIEKPAPPMVLDARVDARTEDVRRAPVVVRRHVEEVRPDGTRKVTDSERDIGAVEDHVEATSSSSHQEIPAPVRRARTRYLGLGVDPVGYARLPRFRGGVTLWERLDAGLAVDPRRRLDDGAVTIEAAWRF